MKKTLPAVDVTTSGSSAQNLPHSHAHVVEGHARALGAVRVVAAASRTGARAASDRVVFESF